MLVLSRKMGEKILIGTDIEIQVVWIERGKIRLGIKAPRDVPVLRGELFGTQEGKYLSQNDGDK
jgi:carbon storage regulator